MAILKVKDKDGVFVNIPSIIGPKGDAGAPGPQGPQGPKGEPGKSGVTDYNELINIPITNLEGTRTKPVIMRDLSVGLYWIKGYHKLYASRNVISETKIPDLLLVAYRDDEYSKVLSFAKSTYDDTACHIYKITDNDATSYAISDETDKIGNTNLLKTTDKTSLVNAVNEIQGQIGNINTVLATLTEVSE